MLVFAHACEKHGKNAPRDQSDNQRGQNVAKPSWFDRIIRKAGLGNPLNIGLLTAGLVASVLQRCQGQPQLLVGEFAP